MLKKKDYERELTRMAGVLKAHKDHSREELDAIGKSMPIRVMQDAGVFVRWCDEKELGFVDSYILFSWIVTQFKFLDDVKVSGDITYSEACKFYEQARISTIVIHRVSYILHDTMSRVYDILEKDRRFRFGVKKAYKEAEGIWDGYLREHRKSIEDAAWYTLLHHLSLASDSVSPFLEKVYESIRDNMIARRMRDIEVRARVSVVLLMGKVAGHTFRSFFEDFEEECGADFSGCFAYDDLSEMTGRFVEMCGYLGIGMEKDVYGYWRMRDYDPEECLRFRKAWADFMAAMRDDSLMDRTAVDAIEHNEEISKEYHRVLRQQEDDMMSESLSRLGEKYKIR